MSITAVKYQNDTCNSFLFVLFSVILFGGTHVAKKTTQLLHIRVPKELHRKIQREADRHGQTINAEILVRLEGSFTTDKTLDVAKDALAQAVGRVEEATTNFWTIANAAIKAVEPDEKKRQLISESLSGYPADTVARVIENATKKLKPGGKQ
jgi:hypothetical protein